MTVAGRGRAVPRLLSLLVAALLPVVVLVPAGPALAAGDSTSAAHDVVVSTEPAAWTPWVRDGRVEVITQVGGVVVLGGSFSSVSAPRSETTVTRTSLVALDAATGQVLAGFAPQVNGTVEALAPGPRAGTVYVGGAFTKVNGVDRKSLALLDIATGSLVAGWNSPYMNGWVSALVPTGGRLIIGGTFTKIGQHFLGGLASVHPTTGAVDTWMSVDLTENHNWTTGSTGAKAPVGVEDMDLTPDGRTLVTIGNFRKADGLDRDQIALIDVSGAAPQVRQDWMTTSFSAACSTRSFDSWVRDVDVAPDGSYFVVATTGGPYPGTLCDTASRWELSTSSTTAVPTWTAESGGDTLLSIVSTGSAVFVGGHQRWMNNPDGRDNARGGAVPRPGLSAHDPQSGVPLSWNAARHPRGVGAGALFATSTGLWVGSDTEYIGNFSYRRPRIAFFPVVGGSPPVAGGAWTLPANVYQGGRVPAPADPSLVRRWVEGTSIQTTNTVDGGGVAWDSVRGAFVVDGELFHGASDGLFYRRSFDGATIGPAALVDPYNDPAWSTVGTGSGSSVYRGSRPSLYGSELASVTGMTYLSDRILYTLAGSSRLYWRWFSPDSGIVGPKRGEIAGAVVPTDTRGLFTADGWLWYAHGAGSLSRQLLGSGPVLVPGSTQVVGGPAVDGVDWRGRALFVGPGPTPPPNAPPEAVIATTCTQLSCSFDGSASSDPEGSALQYAWDLGDGTTATTSVAAHTFDAPGTYTVQLTVTDVRGAAATTTRDITVSDGNVPPTPDVDVSCTDLSCRLDGTGSFDSDGTVAAWVWELGDGSSAEGPVVDHAYPATGTYVVRLTTTDDAGATAQVEQDVSVTAPPTEIEPRGAATTQVTFTRGTVPVPSGTELGDSMLLFATVNSATPTITGPPGWVESGRRTSGTMVTVLWSRTAVASDLVNGATVTLSQSAKLDLQLTAYAGVDAAAPVSAVASGADLVTTAVHTTPTVTVGPRDAWVVSYWADKSSSTTVWTAPVGTTMRGVSYGSGSGYITSLMADGGAPVPSGSQAGGLTATTDAPGSRATTWTVVLRPAQE